MANDDTLILLERTIDLLQNFSRINDGIAIQPGDVVRTIDKAN